MPIEGKELGVIVRAPITKNSYVTEYKYCIMHTTKKSCRKAEKDYIANSEGCYILEAKVDGSWVYFDATRRFNSYGRFDS